MKHTAFVGLTLAVLVGPIPVWAQDAQRSNEFYGFAVGTHHLWETNGFTVQASVGRWRWPKRRPSGFGVRLDAFAAQFEGRVASRLETMGVAGLTASVLRGTKTLNYYSILGPSVNYFYRHPNRRGAVRPGYSLGAGLAWPLRARGGPLLSLEARFQVIFGPGTLRALDPISVGILF